MILQKTIFLNSEQARASVTMLLTGARGRVSGFIHNRRRAHVRALVLSAMFLVLPFLLVGSCNSLSVAALGVVAEGRFLRDNPLLAHMSAREEGRYARTLADLVESDPSIFLKLLGSDVNILLDKADLVRADGPITVWQYRSDSCVLDVYLAAGDKNDTARVVDYEARTRLKAKLGRNNDADAIDDALCLRSVMAARAVVLASL